MTDLEKLLRVLSQSGVRFIIVGGAASTAHGCSRLTQDLDIVYERSEENIERPAQVLSDYHTLEALRLVFHFGSII